VRASYDYIGQQDDELSFCRNAIITNVQKHDGGWYVMSDCVTYRKYTYMLMTFNDLQL